MVAHELVRLGCRHLKLIDPDFITYSNQNRQLYANSKTLNLFKVEVTKSQLLLIQPELDIQIDQTALTLDNDVAMLENADIVVDCVDQPQIKQCMEKICEVINLPLVHGAVDGWFGQVAVCYPHDRILETLYQKNQTPVSANIVMTVNVVASLQSCEVYKVLCEPSQALRQEVLMIDLLHHEMSKVSIYPPQ